MLRCIIVEDEPLGQQIIAAYIAQTPELHLSAICNNTLEAFEILQQQSIQLIFLDIKMPRLNGIDFLKALKSPPSVIFITAYSEFAVESYELDAVDYLVKPVTYERFTRSIHKLLKTFATDKVEKLPDYLFIKVDGKLVKINHNSLQYIEAKKDYLKIVTQDKTYITHMTMKTMQTLLPPEIFTRIHRSYIIAQPFVTVIGVAQIELGQKMIPVGGSYKKQLLKVKEAIKK